MHIKNIILENHFLFITIVPSSEEQKVQAKRLFDEAKRLFDEAMTKGYAECSTIRCLIHGSAGMGKTHLKHLHLKMLPPELRTSTGIADNPVRAVTVSAVGMSKQDEDDWHVLDGDYDLMCTVGKMIRGYVVPLPKRDESSVVQPAASHSSHPGPSQNGYGKDDNVLFTSVPSKHTHDVVDEHHVHTKDVHPPVAVNAPSVPDPIQPDSMLDQLSVEESFINIINQLTGECLANIIVECSKVLRQTAYISVLRKNIFMGINLS